MFAAQCEQTTSARGCTTVGVCGKTPETSALQDLLVHSVKGLGSWAYTARRTVGYSDPEIDHFVNQAMFSTLTNVNFDEARFPEYLVACHGHQERLKAKIAEMGGPAHRGDAELWSTVPNPVDWNIMEAVNNDACVTNFMDLGTQVRCLGRSWLYRRTSRLRVQLCTTTPEPLFELDRSPRCLRGCDFGAPANVGATSQPCTCVLVLRSNA